MHGQQNVKSNFMKIHPVGAYLFHADRQTDMTKLIVPVCNFANAPKSADLRPYYEWD
jgi:hypothetical protein